MAKKDKMTMRNKKRDIKHKNKRKEESSEEESSEEEEEEMIDQLQYKKMLNKLFPSKYMNEKVKKEKSKQKSKSKSKKAVKKSKKTQESSDSESESSEDEEDLDEYEEGGMQKFDIVFTIAAPELGEDDDEYDEEEDSEEEDSDSEEEESDEEDEDSEDEDSDSEYLPDEDEEDEEEEDEDEEDEEEEDEEEDEEEEDEEEEDEEEEEKEEDTNEKKDKKTKVSKKQNKGTVAPPPSPKKLRSKSRYTSKEVVEKFKEMGEELKKKDKNNKTLQTFIAETEAIEKQVTKKERKKQKKQKSKNTTKFQELTKNKNLNDAKYFKESLDVKTQDKILKELEEMSKLTSTVVPHRIQLLESDIPHKFKAPAFRKINALRHMSPGVGEYYKVKNWVDLFMQIPFNKHNTLPVSIDNGLEKCQEYMNWAQKTLDDAVYGMKESKTQIMQLVGQWISNPSSTGTAIAVKGPMGTGKTTLLKNGVSKILNREFAFIALGGATDSSFLEGHSYTYEGSMPGKIVDILIQCKSSNPVIYFDELDKVSDSPKGEEIIGILMHLIDTSQNAQFHDKYFAELDFDLSKCLFIFSYNDESKVNPILRDRMYKIETKGYDVKEKVTIAVDYLLPTIIKEINFKPDDIVITPKLIEFIIEKYTEKEEGVRNLKRCLEIVYTKLNLYRLMKPGSKLFNDETALEMIFPYTVTEEIVLKLIKCKTHEKGYLNMYL